MLYANIQEKQRRIWNDLGSAVLWCSLPKLKNMKILMGCRAPFKNNALAILVRSRKKRYKFENRKGKQFYLIVIFLN